MMAEVKLPTLDAEAIRAVVAHIRDWSTPAYHGGGYTMEIDPLWLTTPARRLKLWNMLQRLHDIEEESRG